MKQSFLLCEVFAGKEKNIGRAHVCGSSRLGRERGVLKSLNCSFPLVLRLS